MINPGGMSETSPAATGGFAHVNSNNYEDSFTRLVQEQSMYYMLAFNSGEEKDNGRYVPVKVTVKRRGLKVLARDGAQRLVRSLHDSLRADIDPRAGCHLAVHHQSGALQLTEFLPRSPASDEIAVGDENARSAVMRAQNANRLAALYQQRLVVLEIAQLAHNRVERFPVARGPAVSGRACRRVPSLH